MLYVLRVGCPWRDILPITTSGSNRKSPVHPDYRRYKNRNRIKRMFAKLKQQRELTRAIRQDRVDKGDAEAGNLVWHDRGAATGAHRI
jgi:transposase